MLLLPYPGMPYIIALPCRVFIILCSSGNGEHVCSQFGDTIWLGFCQDRHVHCETLCSREDILYGFLSGSGNLQIGGHQQLLSWGSACNTYHDEGGRSSARSINCHSIILECSSFGIAGRPSPTQTFCCLSALSELGNNSSSNGLLLLGRLDKCVANDHVGDDGKEERIGGNEGTKHRWGLG